MTTRYPSFAADILTLFEKRGAGIADVAVLQPADPFLDIAGEDLRRRIFLTESETGEALCLRPDFTIPVCLNHIASEAETPRRYAYLGQVFRQRRDDDAEFLQAGIEDLGETDTALADARSIADAHALLNQVLPDVQLSTTLGDQHVFEAVLAALGLPRGWQKQLLRAFGSAEQLGAMLEDLSNPQRASAQTGAAAALIAGGDRDGLAGHVASLMVESGLSKTAGRSPEEIASRLIEKAELRNVRLSRETFDALKSFLAIRVPLSQATQTLQDFATGVGISLGDALQQFASRVAAISGQGLPTDSIDYDAGFGRPLDYYTGLVFEISGNLPKPLVGGGRYDRLLTMLGADTPIPGVGFSVWLDRIEALRGEQSA